MINKKIKTKEVFNAFHWPIIYALGIGFNRLSKNGMGIMTAAELAADFAEEQKTREEK
jgi:hypothetical protein